jgi:subtilisin-like proprotein convertase family protein
VAIPDNDPAGASATITVDVEEPLIIGSLAVEIDLTHTWVGDLELVLSHGDTQHTLWNRSGGSDDDIRASFRVDAFNGTDAAGTWTLHMVDHAGYDTGTLNSWRMTIGE